MLGDSFCTLTVDLSSMYADLRHEAYSELLFYLVGQGQSFQFDAEQDQYYAENVC